jgi:hypothetical protein
VVGTTGTSQMSNINRLHQGAGIFSTLKPRAIFSPALTQNQSAGPKARSFGYPSRRAREIISVTFPSDWTVISLNGLAANPCL